MKPCTMGMGCDEYGVCYAAAHGDPSRCERPEDTVKATWIDSLVHELLMSKATHQFSLSRDELIEIFGGVEALMSIHVGHGWCRNCHRPKSGPYKPIELCACATLTYTTGDGS